MAEILKSTKVAKATAILRELSPVIVAFSGGADSTFLLKLSIDTLGPENVLAVTGISPSIPIEEQNTAKEIAKQIGTQHLFLETHEMENPDYKKNPGNRCFFCKEELFARLEKLRIEKKYKSVVDGTNADDASEWRPGMKAATAYNVRSPLLEAGLTKQEIRDLSKALNLPTWDKPAMPCLSSRVPYGEEITPERLSRIHEAEKLLLRAGFSEVRVRDHFPTARIEVPLNDLTRLTADPLRTEIVSGLKKIGYLFITLDLSGLKSGSLNQVLNVS